MSRIKHLIPAEYALVITGSLNAMEEDREHDARSSIHPVQVFMDGALHTCAYFDGWGDLGVSAFAFSDDPREPIYITTGNDLIQLRMNGDGAPQVRRISVQNLRDVHEITLLGNLLWLSNTGYDEAVAFDTCSLEVRQRIPLAQFRNKRRGSLLQPSKGSEVQEVDRYHCNQVFQGMDGHLYALVHHVSGRQLLARIAKKLIKNHGDGGVIDLQTGSAMNLSLHAPHSVRRVGDEYWICDSGGRHVNIYDADWRPRGQIDTIGWGRGADVLPDLGLFFVGISAQRKRYRDVPGFNDRNLVQVISIRSRSIVGEIPIEEGIEQVNNVYLVPASLASSLLRL